MPKNEDSQSRVLIVSGSAQFDILVKKALPPRKFITIDFQKSVSAARRTILEKNYDLVLINAPLADEMGHEFAMDVADRSDSLVMLAVPSQIYGEIAEHVMEYGILAVPKPLGADNMRHAVDYLCALHEKVRKQERRALELEEKLNELRLVSKAKVLLVEKKHLTEAEAHQYIGKQAMDHGMSKKRIAERLIEELE